MKKLNVLFGILALVFFSACTSLEKMVERGNYDEAIIRLAKKMSGKKKKKTKDVKTLEKAFQKITEEDLIYASNLASSGRPSAWDEIYDTYDKIDERQSLIKPFLPLVSKDGYRAKFKFANVTALKREAAEKATAYNYNEAVRLIDLTKNGGRKASARKAYDALTQIEKYNDRYKDSRKLKREARYLGTNRVLVKLHNNTFGFMPREVEQEIMSINVKEMNTFWTEYFTKSDIGHEFDFVARLDLDEIAISPEREVVNRYIDETEIKDGWKYVLDENGNVKKDSLGNDIKEDKFVTVRADIVEIHRTKSAIATGRFGLFDATTKELIDTRPFNVGADFEDYASSYDGDRRALCDRTRNRLSSSPEAFPNDLLMSLDVAHHLKELMKTEISRFSI